MNNKKTEINFKGAGEKLKNHVSDLLFPAFCLGCGIEGSYLCQDCKAVLEISEHCYCLCDKNPLRLPANSKTGKCNKCSQKKLSGIFSALPYKEKPLTKKLIYFFKYSPYVKELAKPLAEILINHFCLAEINNRPGFFENALLVPVPLHISKLKSRGYNQSEELAKELSKNLKILVVSDVLIKIKSTPPQMELKKEGREKNLQGAFSINLKKCGKPDLPHFSGKKIFLVDDVYTTGFTMEECSAVLKKAGAKQVWGIALAREG